MTNIFERRFNLQEVAGICGVSVMTIVREIKRRNLGCFRVGHGKGKLLVSESQLKEYLKRCELKVA
jgi:excisionase family DNA binding protein